jgi:hypothetical protein
MMFLTSSTKLWRLLSMYDHVKAAPQRLTDRQSFGRYVLSLAVQAVAFLVSLDITRQLTSQLLVRMDLF